LRGSAPEVVAAVNAELIVDLHCLLYLPKGVHRHLSVCSSDVRLPEDQRGSQTLGLISAENSDGITEGFDAVKLDARYGIPIDHGVDRARSSAMVHDEPKLVDRLWHGVHGNYIHSGEQIGEWFREPPRFDFLLTLPKEEISFPVVFGGMLWFTVGDGISILLFSPRPETLRKSDDYRFHKGLVRVILEELTEFFNIYFASYFK
jgi:hypothetical protein